MARFAEAPTTKQRSAVIAGIAYWAEYQEQRQPLPDRDDDDSLRFPDFPEFRPNLTPEQVLRAGSFGGTYFRSITSSVTKCTYPARVHEEFPARWFAGLDLDNQVTSSVYRPEVNAYGVKSGNDLAFWEGKGWMRTQDPYGWFQWYCRFYLGRRTEDDARQISRWVGAIGLKGRWRTFLIGQCVKAGKSVDDVTVSPVTRQTLLHWGYKITQADYDQVAPAVKAGKSVIYMGVVVPPSPAPLTPPDVAHESAQAQQARRTSGRKRRR